MAAIYIKHKAYKSAKQVELLDGKIVVDYNADGEVIGIEVIGGKVQPSEFYWEQDQEGYYVAHYGKHRFEVYQGTNSWYFYVYRAGKCLVSRAECSSLEHGQSLCVEFYNKFTGE